MAQVTILYWRDIPTQIIVKEHRKTEKIILNKQFMEAVDSAAMRAGMAETNDYLEQWRKSKPTEINGNIKEIAQNFQKNIEEKYTRNILKELINNGGINKKNSHNNEK